MRNTDNQEVKMKIVDCHCHIASDEHTPRSFIEPSVANIVAAFSAQGLPVRAKTLMAMFQSKMQDPLGDPSRSEMTEAGICKSILLVPDFSYAR